MEKGDRFKNFLQSHRPEPRAASAAQKDAIWKELAREKPGQGLYRRPAIWALPATGMAAAVAAFFLYQAPMQDSLTLGEQMQASLSLSFLDEEADEASDPWIVLADTL